MWFGHKNNTRTRKTVIIIRFRRALRCSRWTETRSDTRQSTSLTCFNSGSLGLSSQNTRRPKRRNARFSTSRSKHNVYEALGKRISVKPSFPFIVPLHFTAASQWLALVTSSEFFCAVKVWRGLVFHLLTNIFSQWQGWILKHPRLQLMRISSVSPVFPCLHMLTGQERLPSL